MHWVGDFITEVSGDSYASAVAGCVSEGTDSGAYLVLAAELNDTPGTSWGAWYAARLSDGTGANGDNLFKVLNGVKTGQTRLGGEGIQAATWNGQVLYTNLGGVCDCAARTYRGQLPALKGCLHDYEFMTDDTTHGNFQYHKYRYNGANYGGFMIDTGSDFR